tara:strand:- start:414 stop:1271 length:858 start_codon:yes stop_codon:yes gene_type:complete
MDDDEWLAKMSPDKPEWQYHEICLWSPFIEDTVDKVANRMKLSGFDRNQSVVLYEGKILDGRHRYLAAVKAGIDPIFSEFHGSREEAIEYVTMRQVERGHWTNEAKEYYYAKRAEALGVRERKDNQHTPNSVSSPSQADHAKSLGVHLNTVNRWEKDRKDIMSDPKLAEKATTPEGYKDAKKVVRDRRAEKKKAINNTVAPKVIDLNAIARDKKETDIRSVGPAFVGLMETLCTKFDEKDIKRELVAFMHPDPLGLKAEALQKMSDILNDLREDFSTETTKQQLN